MHLLKKSWLTFTLPLVFVLADCSSKRVSLHTTNNTPVTITVKTPWRTDGPETFTLLPYQSQSNAIDLPKPGPFEIFESQPLETQVLQPTNLVITTSIATNISGSTTNIGTNFATNFFTLTSSASQPYDDLPKEAETSPITKIAVISFLGTTNLSGFTYNVFKINFYP